MIFRRAGNLINAAPRNRGGEFDVRTAERTLRDVGLSRTEAKRVLAMGWDATFGGDPEIAPRDVVQVTAPPLRDAATDLLSKLKDHINGQSN